MKGLPILSRLSPDRRDQALLFGVMLAIAAGNTGLQSVLPAIGRSLSLPDPLVAGAFSFSALLYAIAAPFWARRLDRHGSKRMVLIGMGGFIVSTIICALALTAGLRGWIIGGVAFAIFVAGRTFYGCLGAAAPPAAQALIVAETPRTDRVKALSLLASAFGLGTILGPAFAPFFILPFVGLAGPLYVSALMGIAIWLLIAIHLPDVSIGEHVQALPSAEPAIGGEPDDARVMEPRDNGNVRFRDPRIWPWMLFGLVGGHAQAIAGQTLAFFMIDRIGVAPVVAQPLIGMVLMSGAGAALLAQWGVIPRLNMDPRQIVIWGAGFAALGCTGVALSSSLHTLAVSFTIAQLGFGFLRPGFTAGASLAVNEDEQGSVAGRVTATNGLVFVLGPASGILMYEVWRPLPYLASAVAMLAMLAYGLRRLPKGLMSR